MLLQVCVSLLGTWNGKGTEVWTSQSNLLQVIISIQGKMATCYGQKDKTTTNFMYSWKYRGTLKPFIKLDCKFSSSVVLSMPDLDIPSNLRVMILGLILVSEPYFNEAGYERQKGTQQGRENSRMYNEMVVLKLIQAMAKVIQAPPDIFKKEIIQHFHKKAFK